MSPSQPGLDQAHEKTPTGQSCSVADRWFAEQCPHHRYSRADTRVGAYSEYRGTFSVSPSFIADRCA